MGSFGLRFILLTSALDSWMVVALPPKGIDRPRHPDIRASVFISESDIHH